MTETPKVRRLKKVPTNFFGSLYPSYDHDRLLLIFDIRPDEKVLDIGGGHNPFPRADYIVECDLHEGIHRDGQQIPPEVKARYMEADIHELPFDDKSIDFIFCSHVLEHVADPEKACSEIIRVGKRGYIETPRKWVEFFAGYPSHQWLVDNVNGELVFERRQFLESPYLNALLHSVWKHRRLEERALKDFLNISCVQFYWEEEFSFRVVDSGSQAFDYSKSQDSGFSHFYFARNILRLGAPLNQGLFHVEAAVKFCPEDKAFWALHALYALLLKREDLWSKSFGMLHNSIVGRRDAFLLKFGFRQSLIAKLMKIVEAHEYSQ